MKKTLSPSSINQFMKCSAQYWFKKIIGPKPPTIALLYGTAVDEAINVDLEQKITTHEDLPVDDVKDAFVSKWDEGKQETLFFDNDKPEELREVGINSVGHWLKETAPTVQPMSIQEKLEAKIDGSDYELFQFADVITTDNEIIDNKTSGRSLPDKNGVVVPHDHRVQLTMYSLGFKYNYGQEPSSLGLDYLVKNKSPKVQRARWKPNGDDSKLVLSLINRVAKGIDKEVFIPNRAHFMCSKRFCAFWRECQQEFGGKVKS